MSAQRRRIWTDKELARIVRARCDGLTFAEIGQRFDCTGRAIAQKLAKLREREDRGALSARGYQKAV